MKRFSSRLTSGIFATCAGLFAILVGVTSVAFQYRTYVDNALGLSSSKAVSSGDEEEVDSLYFKSDFETAQEVVDYRNQHMEEVGAESSVLLKNENNALPLGTSGVKVTLFGMSSYNPNYGNTNNPMGFTEAFAYSNIEVNPTMMSFYEGLSGTYARSTSGLMSSSSTFSIGEVPASEYDAQRSTLEASYAEYDDAAIVVLSREAGEGGDLPRTTDGYSDHDGDSTLGLNSAEKAMIQEAKNNFEKVIVLINSSNAMEIHELEDDEDIDAIVWIGLPGSRGLVGVGRVLTGEENFSGKLADTYAVNNAIAPGAINSGDFQFTNADSIDNSYGKEYLIYAEGIYVGYRYYETRYEDTVLGYGNADSAKGANDGIAWDYENEVTYSFGYGLSYTDFTQEFVSGPTFTSDGNVEFSVKVTNTGTVAGMSVVQVYFQAPYTHGETTIEKAAVQLLTYDKTVELAAGASTTVDLSVPAKYLASYDESGNGSYVLEKGNYYFALGNGAHDALNNILTAKGYKTSDGMDYNGKTSYTTSWYNEEDDYTYTTSDTGVTIKNQFDDADINYFYEEDVVTYLSRNDWEGTWSDAITDITATDEMLPDLSGDTYEAGDSDVSSITVGADNGKILLDYRGVDYDDESWDELLDQLTYDDYSNIARYSGAPIAEIESIGFAGLPVNGSQGCTDYPNGMSTGFRTDDSLVSAYAIDSSDELASYTFRTLASENNLGATFSPRLAEQQGRVFGNDGLWSEMFGSWSAGLNIHRNAYSGRNYEYFSEDPMLTNIQGSNMISAAYEYGHIMIPKHFALNDQEDNRQSVATFANEQSIREIYLRAFEGPMSPDEGGGLGIMTAFNRIGVIQASISYPLVTTVLKDEWGFNGFVITDMAYDTIQYGRASIVAGTDMMLNAFSTYADLAPEYFSSDIKLLSAMREAAHHTLYVVVNSAGMNGFTANTSLVAVINWWQPTLIIIDVLLGLVAIGALTFFIAGELKDRKNKADTNAEPETKQEV